MRRALRVWCAVFALAFTVGPGALVATGDDGPPPSFPTGRPTRAILRPTEVIAAAPKQSDKEVILLVGGINSSPQDPTFDALIAKALADPRYVVHRFGADPTYPYDSLGGVDANARSLTDEVRALGATHPAVHIVAHSMGGAVVDRAFSTSGLSARDGVVSYIALASPHSGSASLGATVPVLDLIGDPSLEVRAALSPKVDVGSDAARELRHGTPPGRLAGVTRLDLRMSTDWTVTARDAADPGIESRTLTPSGIGGVLDGHGAITSDARVIDLVTTTIATRTAPADTRSAQVIKAADRQSDLALVASLLICGAGLLAAGLLRGVLSGCAPLRFLTRPIAEAQLRDVRRK